MLSTPLFFFFSFFFLWGGGCLALDQIWRPAEQTPSASEARQERPADICAEQARRVASCNRGFAEEKNKKKKGGNPCWNSPYLLMEVRDMLAEEGMLYDDVCLGTKATTQRSDTCVKRRMARWFLMSFRS